MSPVEKFHKSLERLGPFEPHPHLAVAVSGGPDSLALALLCQEWVKAKQGNITALVVDHGLRPTSAQEAAQTLECLKARHIPSALLKWKGSKPTHRLMERARAARYGLLWDWCHSQGVLHLLVAHHKDDQEETRLMRFLQNSHLEGLGAMRPVSYTPYGRLLRPLLSFQKKELVDFLAKNNQPHIQDPSNVNPVFLRGYLRQSPARFPFKGPFESVRDHLEGWKNTFLANHGKFDGKAFYFEEGTLQRLPFPFQEILIKHILMALGKPSDYPPRTASVRYALSKLPSKTTLHGCSIALKKGCVFITKEPGRPLKAHE